MTQSVPPPEPPAIVQHLSPKILSTGNRGNIPFAVSQLVTTNPPSSPKPVKSLILKTSDVSAVKSAAFLGSEMGMGYTVEQFEITDADIGLNTAAAPMNSLQQTHTKTKPISPFRPSASALVNKLLASRVSPESPSNRNSNFVSQSPTQPVELDFRAPTVAPQPPTVPIPEEQIQPTTQPPKPSQPSQPPNTAPVRRRIVEVNSDRQEYDAQRRVVTAEGNVLVRLEDGVLDADRLQVNLQNLIAVGEGNVAFTRGKQVLRGQRFTFNILQNSGNMQGGRGDIFIPTAGADFSDTLATDVTSGSVFPRPPSDRLSANQPLEQVTSTGGIDFTVGAGRRNASNLPGSQQGGQIRRLRFQANQIYFYPLGWQARDVRITNDPFSPPELELRADTVTLTRETPLRDRIRTTRQRLVFDQGLSLPIPRNQAVIDRNQRDVSPAIAQIGYDGTDRGGVFIERGFPILNSGFVQFNIKPQFFIQKAVSGNGNSPIDPSVFGLKANLNATPGPRTAITGAATFTSLDLGDIEDSLRARLQLQQVIGTSLPHTLTLESSYRDRLYNGTLGYQDVQSTIGGIVTSPTIPLGNSGINLSYQAGAQYINANTDRLELLEAQRENDRVSLSRFQGSFALSRGFLLWQGKGLPATATQGLKYTPVPVIPYVTAYAGVTGTSSFYSNGDNQSTLIGTIGVEGQFGHFSRPFFDYTRLNISYSEGIRSGISPFFFDRAADTRVVSFGITQQIYGPLRLGFQTAINLDNNDTLTTDYILEYSRRTYGIFLRYNPEQELGSISFRLSDFNWAGSSDPFSDAEVRPVVGGVRR